MLYVIPIVLVVEAVTPFSVYVNVAVCEPTPVAQVSGLMEVTAMSLFVEPSTYVAVNVTP